MAESKINSRYHVTNLERALRVFELLAENPQGLTSSDISKQLAVSRNSVFRIASTLVDHGFLTREDDRRTFHLSLKLLSIGIKSRSAPSVVEQALPIMHQLQSKYRETIPLGVLSGEQGVVLEEVEGTHHFRYVLDAGKLFYLHTSAPGKAMMAYLPKDEQTELVNKLEYKVFNERTIDSPKRLKAELVEVREKGYAVDRAEEIEGMHCVGAPIFNRKGRPVAAIWITGPSTRIHEKNFDKIGTDVRNHTDIISQKLGYHLQSD
jgi:DNA-binding IclR family transcriptional regulator